jgi:hypothetical protein
MKSGHFDQKKEGDGTANQTEHHEPDWDVNHGVCLPSSPNLIVPADLLPLFQIRGPFAIEIFRIKRA